MVGSSSRATVLTLVERRSKYTRYIKVEDKTSQTIHDALSAFFDTVPASCRKSITYDNGKENVLHDKINKTFQMSSYFCDPYSAWHLSTSKMGEHIHTLEIKKIGMEQRLVENTIGLFRQFFPKKTNFNKVDSSDILKVQVLMNNRPRFECNENMIS